jgi:hypothetical protein
MITVTVSLNSLGIPPSVLPARLSGRDLDFIADALVAAAGDVKG